MSATGIFLGTDVKQVGVSDAVDAFLESLALKSETVRWYGCRLRSLPDLPIGELMAADLVLWRREIASGRSPYTVAGYCRAVRRWLDWCYELGLLMIDLTPVVVMPRLPRIGRRGIKDVDLKRMLDAAHGHKRDFAMLHFLRATGARLGGLCNLRLGDLMNDRRVVVFEKFDKSRIVFLDRVAEQALEGWIVERCLIDCETDHVFVGRSNSCKSWHKLAGSSVRSRFKLWAEVAGVSEDFTPHQFRHRFGRRLTEQGIPLGVVSQLMGHSGVGVTVRHYGQFAVGQLQNLFDRASL